MKRFLVLFLSAILLISFASCTAPADTGNQGGKTPKDSKYFFKVANKDNYAVKIDADMADVLKALGEPLQYFEAASCAFDGLDKTYTYAGYVILTRPDGKKDYVNSIQLTDDSVQTPEGAYVGMTPDAVKGIYGKPTEETETLLSYTDGNTTLNFILKDAKVISIEYLPA
ncbi:MAG: hypothetical protein IJ404_03070 [Clostridia bacterium]|nr:hypothetical protein [Clostridia bacterium]